MEISARSYLTAGMALTTASAIAFTPLVSPHASPHGIALPHISTSTVQLTALITPADIGALINNLNTAANSVSSTATSLVGVPGQTLVGALNSAVALSNTLWDGLIAATSNPTLVAVLTALKASSNGGLTSLATTVGATNDTLTLTTGQVADLLTSTLTGSLGTALQAVANIINNPLSVSSYTGLLTAPLGIVGLALNNGLTAARDLGVNALTLGTALVTGVTAQITNILSTVNGLIGAAGDASGSALVDGVLTAVQGIVSAPVTVAVAGVNGVTSAFSGAASIALTKLTNGASSAVSTWFGEGTSPGALQTAINTIGAAPLSPASYTNALSVLVGAGVTTVNTVFRTAGSLASIPFSTAANLTTTAANMITSFTSGVATVASGLLEAAGLPSLVYGLPHALAATVNGAVNVAAFATSAGLNVIASALDIGSTIAGALSQPRVLTLSVASDSPAAVTPESAQSVSATGSATDTTQGAASSMPAEGKTTKTAALEEATKAATEVDPAAQEAAGSPVAIAVPEKTAPASATVTEEATEVDETTAASVEPKDPTTDTKDTTTSAARRPSTTADTPSNEPKKAAESAATAPTTRKEPKDESEKDSAKKDESKKPASSDSSGTTTGGKHAPGAVKNGTSVHEIKSKLDKEAAAGASTSRHSAAAA
ncbi:MULTISPECIES: hypothetical protein [Mycolicibacterium]|uniref:PE-PGRS family protein n=1 Tax=Mycolicibacterium goodii TaxID=134601 RepID=A0ABS6HIN2_MYCGD|nr:MULTISPECIES: hypothetical protein [Mycolicibacterium]MBU8821465.1 hypothetical protein [Mycolicibacterium goodii]MBU8836211.1 hypothetical protein [Mycolicibacterium goodii]